MPAQARNISVTGKVLCPPSHHEALWNSGETRFVLETVLRQSRRGRVQQIRERYIVIVARGTVATAVSQKIEKGCYVQIDATLQKFEQLNSDSDPPKIIILPVLNRFELLDLASMLFLRTACPTRAEPRPSRYL